MKVRNRAIPYSCLQIARGLLVISTAHSQASSIGISREGDNVSEDSILKRNWVKGSAVLATAALSLVLAAPAQAAPLAKVKSATQGATENVVEVTF